MKTLVRLSVLVGLVLFGSIILSAQKPAAMVGTWAGVATLQGEAGPNELTLVLELKEGELAGHMSDQFGTMNQAPLSEITLAQGVFNFIASALGPNGTPIVVKFKMKVTGEKMEGTLEIPDMGMNGTWEATLKKSTPDRILLTSSTHEIWAFGL